MAARRLALLQDPEAAVADPIRDPAVLAEYRQRFSFAAAGALYQARLEDLWAQRRAGVGGAAEVAGGCAGLRGVAGARRGRVVADGARPPQAPEATRKHR